MNVPVNVIEYVFASPGELDYTVRYWEEYVVKEGTPELEIVKDWSSDPHEGVESNSMNR